MKLLLSVGYFICAGVCFAQTVPLAVLNGYGSGNYRAGDTVHIWARELPEDSVFAGWETPLSSVVVLRPTEWHTALVMPQSPVSIRAIFRHSKPLHFTETQFRIMGANRNVWFAFPDEMRGLITLHHFTNGTGNLWTSRTEYRQFCHAALDRGYGLLAYNADEVERGDRDGDNKKQWKALPVEIDQNPDHTVTRLLLDTLVRRGILLPQIPIYAVGMSVGGGYTIGVSYSLNFNAWANFCSGGNRVLCEKTRIPGLQCPSEFDSNRDDDPGGNTIRALENYQTLRARGVNAEYLPNMRHPLYPERFARVNGIGRQQSEQLFAELKKRRCLDSVNCPVVNADSIELGIRYTALFPEFSGLREDLWKEALYQYRVAYADHEFHADFSYAILDFFERHSGTSAVEEPAERYSSTLYPQPAGDFLTVQLPVAAVAGQMFCTDALGRTAPLSVVSAAGGLTTLNVAHLPAGVYVCHILTAANKRISRVFMKE